MNIIAIAENYERKHKLKIVRKRLRDSQNPFDIPEARFVELYRLPVERTIALIDEIVPYMRIRKRSDSIPANLLVLSVFGFYASGTYQRKNGQDFLCAISQTIVSNAIKEVSTIICENLAPTYIRFPQTATEIRIVKQKFLEFHRNEMFFPGIIGCVDGGHVILSALRKNEERIHVNRKGSHSKNVQFICDANLKMIGVFTRYSGATHDAYIWSISQARIHLEEKYQNGERTSWLLGDSGYPLEPWLMTPYRPAVTDLQKQYNKFHAVKRNIVERSIGLLKSRFRCISSERPLRYSPVAAGRIITACVVLHNVLINLNFPITPEEELIIEQEINTARDRERNAGADDEDDDGLSDMNLLGQARIIRDRLSQTITN